MDIFILKNWLYYAQFFLLPATLFLTVNWIGAHSISYGYISMALFIQRDDAPAYNVVFRLLSPIIFIIITSSLYYFLGLDFLVIGIWYIVPIYFLFRIAYNLILNKWQLVDKRREVILGIISTIASLIIYTKFIIIRGNLLPAASDLTGELWIIIILYLYNTLNKIDVGTSGSELRRDVYYKKYGGGLI